MRCLPGSDEKSITKEPYRCSHRKGIGYTAAFVAGTAFFVTVLALCNRPASGAPHDHEVEIAAGRQHRIYCDSHQGRPLTPRYAQAGAVVSCHDIGNQVIKQERLTCEQGTGHVRLAGFGTDPLLGAYFTVDCVR